MTSQRKPDSEHAGPRSTEQPTYEELLARVARFEQQQELSFQRIVDEMPEGCAVLSPNWTYLYVNRVNARHARLTPEQMVGRNMLELLPGVEKTAFFESYRRCMEERAPQKLESQFPFADGSSGWFEAKSEPVPEGIFVIVHDITERKRAEEALRRKQAELQVLFDHTPAGLVLFDAKPPYQVLAHNRYYQELFAEPYRSQGMVGLNVSDYAPAVEASGVVAVFDEVVRTKEPKLFLEFPYRSNPPKESWFNWHMLPLIMDGQVVALVSMSIDVTERHLAEAALHASEERYRSLFNGMTEGFALHEIVCDDRGTPIDYRFLDVNPAFERLTGLARSEVVGRLCSEVLPDEVEYWLGKYGPVALDGDPIRFESPSSALGRLYEVLAYCPARGRFAVVFQDVSARKRAAEALSRSQTTFAELVERAPFGIYIVDSRFRIAHMNAASQSGAFRNVRPLIGRPFNEAMHILWPDVVAEEIIGHFRHTLETGEPYFSPRFVNPRADVDVVEAYEWELHRMRLPDGQYGVICYYFDSTQIRAAEAELRRLANDLDLERGRLSAVVENMEEAVGIWSSDGNLVLVNQATAKLYGFETREQMLEHFREYPDVVVWTLDGRELPQEEWPPARALRGETFSNWVLEQYIPSLGKRFVGSNSGCPVRDASGKIVLAVNTVHDITDIFDARRAAERDLEERGRLLDELRKEGQRKTEFLAMLSHELRNPLTPIRNSLFILDRAAPGGEQANRAKAVIERQVSHLIRLVNDLLDVTRITSGKLRMQPARFDLAEMLVRTAEDHRAVFSGAGIDLDVQLCPGPLWMHGDEARVAQAVGNLLGNAAKFTERDGRVALMLRVDAETQMADIHVRDTGIGIHPDLLSKLFEPFVQADNTLDRAKSGLGLGLALVKSVVELHGGTVTVRSAGLGTGAEFIMRLPLEVRAVMPLDQGKRPSSRPPPRRILIIEDNQDSADSLRDMLGLGQHQVEVAYNGPDGLTMAKEFQPEVVLCDIGLPGMSGYELAKALRADESLRAAHLVALTGYALPEDQQRAT
jgi:PAS domain S-box-containing protein